MALQNLQRDQAPPADLYAGEWHIEPARRVYVNRNLRMRNIRIIGFDMDYTLALYDKLALEQLAYDATRDKLIAELHYPESIRILEYDPDCVIRGLVVDKKLGNTLKIDQYGYVTRAYHGLRLIPSERRKVIYRNSRIRLSNERYRSIDTLFGLPEATLFLQLVEHFEHHEKVPYRDYSRVYDDVRRCIDRAHADNTIKREIVGEPERFLVKDTLLPAMLASFRAQGKKLFLLTNSEPYYTQVVMHYLLHGALEQFAEWRDYFDLVIVSAGKPDFYQVERPLLALTPEQLQAAGMPASAAPIHTGGCARLLEESMGHRGDEVLYVGDHTFGDILRAKKRPGWRTAMLIEELKGEIELDRALAHEYQAIDAMLAKRNNTILEINRVRRRLQQVAHHRVTNHLEPEDLARTAEQEAALQARLQTLQGEVLAGANGIKERKAQVDKRFNKHWGKLFKCGDINSRFGQQVKDFACIYTSAASNFLAYPDSMYFRSTREIMPHEMGMDSF